MTSVSFASGSVKSTVPAIETVACVDRCVAKLPAGLESRPASRHHANYLQELRLRSRKPESPSARLALRAATHVVHERLHEAPAFRAIVDRRLDRRGYARLLGRLLAFHRAVDTLIAQGRAALGFGDAAGNGARIGRLEADLAYLGGGKVPSVPAATGDDGQAAGCLYVVEGSVLGGKLIHRQLYYLFAANEDGRSFFAGAADDGARWRDLCGRLDAYGAPPGRLAAMTAGAAAAFALFEACLDTA